METIKCLKNTLRSLNFEKCIRHFEYYKHVTLQKLIVLSFGLLFLIACKKDNAQTVVTTTTSTPLTDFASGKYRGYQGGLYPNGSNQRPSAHNAAGIAIAQAIKPLNSSGSIDVTNGIIVWMSIGMSNTTMDTQAFLSSMLTFTNKNPKLVLIDGAESGQDINKVINSSASYWTDVSISLSSHGLFPAQVQVIWVEEAEASPSDTSFATYPDALEIKYKLLMQILKSKFPNLKLCYLSDRTYAGYATTKLNPEPFAWYTGWTVKRLIAEQIAGSASLNYTGTNPSSAWLSWGAYLWANGNIPRSDGLTWLPTDYQSDGTHPSATGTQKTAQLLLQFFSSDETTKPWFLKP